MQTHSPLELLNVMNFPQTQHLEVISNTEVWVQTMQPPNDWQLLLEMQYRVVELAYAMARQSRSMLCCVWIITPSIPNISEKIYIWVGELYKPKWGKFVLFIAFLNKLELLWTEDKPKQVLMLIGTKEMLYTLVIYNSEAMLKMIQLIDKDSRGYLAQRVRRVTLSWLLFNKYQQSVKERFKD